MTYLTKMQRLLEDVRNGRAKFDWTSETWPRGFGADSAEQAYGGSVDQAMYLMRQHLPKWRVISFMEGDIGRYSLLIGSTDGPHIKPEYAGIAGRVYLQAIISAIILEEQV